MKVFQKGMSPYQRLRINSNYEHHMKELETIKNRKRSQENQPIKYKSQFKRLEVEKWSNIYSQNQRLFQTITNTKSTISNTVDVSDFLVSRKNTIELKPRIHTLPTLKQGSKVKGSHKKENKGDIFAFNQIF